MWPASVAVAAPAVWLVVALQESSPDSALLQYGAVGVIALLALVAVRELFKQKVAAHDYDRARADRLEEQLRTQNQLIQERFVTALEASSRAVQEAMAVLRERR